MTIAIDGTDYSGKSTLARFLAWQLEMPAVETDFALLQGDGPPTHDAKLVERLVRTRHNWNRPVIVEGVFVLRLLGQLGIQPEVVIRAESRSCQRTSSWCEAFEEYNEDHIRSVSPDYLYSW